MALFSRDAKRPGW